VAPAASPRRLEIAAPARGKKLFMFAMGALGFAALVGVVALVSRLRPRTDTPPFPRIPQTRSERLIGLAAGFRSDLALAECDAELRKETDPDARAKLQPLRDEFKWMEIARSRVIEAIHVKRPRLARLRLPGRTLSSVEVLSATATRLIIDAEDRLQEVFWSDVPPPQVLELADLCLPDPAPPERLGLALYAGRAGLKERSVALLRSMRGTELESTARPYEEQP
jgi:hypothetical protein